MSKHLTWMESAAAFPCNISLSSPAIAQAAYISQPFQAHMPHVPCTSPHLPDVQQVLHKLTASAYDACLRCARVSAHRMLFVRHCVVIAGHTFLREEELQTLTLATLLI